MSVTWHSRCHRWPRSTATASISGSPTKGSSGPTRSAYPDGRASSAPTSRCSTSVTKRRSRLSCSASPRFSSPRRPTTDCLWSCCGWRGSTSIACGNSSPTLGACAPRTCSSATSTTAPARRARISAEPDRSRPQRCPAEKVALFGKAEGVPGGAPVVLPCRIMVADLVEEVCADRVRAVAGRGELTGGVVELPERYAGAVHHGHGDDSVERDHGARRDEVEQVVQRQDLPPVGVLGARGFVVHGGDGGLHLI